MWDNIEDSLVAIGRWIVRHPAVVAVLTLVALWFFARGFVVWLFGQLVVLGLLMWGVLLIFGYGRLWGKKKKD